MAEPVVTLYINTNTEGAPSWTEVKAKESIFFGNSNSSSGLIDKLTVPRTGILESSEVWKSSKLYYTSGTQCTTFVVPSVVGQNQNVFRILFADNATTNPPRVKAWDDSGFSTTVKPLFAGTAASTNTSLLKAIETTGGAPAQNWCTINTVNAGGNTVNALKGSTNYLEFAALAGANTSKLFTMAMYVPSDLVNISPTEFNIFLQIEYDYV